MMIESQLGPAASTKTRTDALLWAFWSLQIFPRFFRIGKGEEIRLFGHTLKLIVAHSGLEWTKTGKNVTLVRKKENDKKISDE